MLRSVNSLRGYSILATDGDIGNVDDLYFDDQTWGVAYLVVRLGGIFTGRRVLLPPTALGKPDWEMKQFPVALSKHGIENSPDIDLDKPISRQHEELLYRYFGWTPYWLPVGAPLGVLPLANPPLVTPVEVAEPEVSTRDTDPHLQSAKDVAGYGIQASDGKIGHVEDFVADDATWSIKYVVVDTADWLPGRKVIVSPDWIDDIDWSEETVHITFTRERVKNSPEYDPAQAINREYETRLYDYYGRPTGKA